MSDELLGLAYVSTVSGNLACERLETLLSEAKARNAAGAVTGVLLYCHGTFMQYLEGSPDIVEATFARILRDTRHHDPFVLFKRPIAQREFQNWSMAFSTLERHHRDALLRKEWSGPAAQGRPGSRLLREFWEENCR